MRNSEMSVANGKRIPDVGTMLEQLGTKTSLAPMAIQFAFFLPRTCDPYAAGTQELVKACQRGLAKKGYYTGPIDGGMGIDTAKAVQCVAGPRWYDKNWVQIMGNILYAPVAPPPRVRTQRIAVATPTGSIGSAVGSILDNPLGLVGVGVGVWYFFLRKKGR